MRRRGWCERHFRLAPYSPDHRTKPIGALRRQVFVEAERAENGLGIGRKDLRSRPAGIERQQDRDQTSNDMGVGIPKECQFGVVTIASPRMQPHLADTTRNLVCIVAGILGIGSKIAAEFYHVAVSLLPVVQEREVVSDCIDRGHRPHIGGQDAGVIPNRTGDT